MELSSVASWLESLGYVHTDIRLPNLLLNSQDHLILADFDCVSKTGSIALGGAPPWARIQGHEAGSGSGSFGHNGARVEQFAIGSVLYLMTRGYEPYDDGEFGPQDGKKVVALFKLMKFPTLSGDILDKIIKRCWNGEYASLKDLADDTKLLPGAVHLPRAMPLEEDYYRQVQVECQQLLEAGFK